MQCKTHPDRHAAQTCNHCSSQFCDECAISFQGRILCRSCLMALAGTEHTRYTPYPPPPPRNKVLWGLLFVFSFLPGANYMYMGLLKRGLATMTCFFLLIFMVSSVNMPLRLMLIFAIPVLALSSFFDGFNVRRRINAGEEVRDDIGDALNSILRNKFLCTLILVVVAVTIISTVLSILSGLLSTMFPLLIVGIGIYVIMRRKPPAK